MPFASEVAIAGFADLARDVKVGARSGPWGLRLREALLSTAAAGALSLALGGPALAGPDACTTAGAVVTCTGNQSDGITNFGTPTLIVDNLTQAIAPASGTPGIYSFSLSDVTIVSDTGAFGITTVGDGANGIYAYSSPFAFFYAYPVTVTSTGNITTAGNEADGIYAVARSFGPVTVTSTGNIVTAGSEAHGIYALTIGGAVTVTSSGNITTAGSDAVGIWAQSSLAPIAVTVNSGTVSGGSGSGAGVELAGGTDNTLTNLGTVTALSGLAIEGDTGNNTVNNFGTVTGNVVLGSGTNAFNNQTGGLFNAGATVNLGAGNTLANAGTLSPGGVGTIQTTALTGNLTQSATGRLLADINIAGATSDRVNVSGTAALAGTVQVQLQNLILGPWQQTVLSATGGTTNNGLSLLPASPALHMQLTYPNATDVVVQSSGINFLVPGLNGNQTSVAAGLNGAALSAGLGGPVLNALLTGFTSLGGYSNALTQLSGEPATESLQTTFDAMGQFMGVLTDPFTNRTGGFGSSMSSGYAEENAYAARSNPTNPFAMFTKAPPAPFVQRWSVWASGYGGSQSTDGNAAVGSNNTTSSIYGTAVGADYLFSPDTIAGLALAGGGTNFSVNGSGSGRSDLFQAGAYVRHTEGAAYITAALAYGWQDITTDRYVTAAGFDHLRAEFNANAYSGRVEGGYRFVTPWTGGIGLTPYAAAQFTTFDLPAYAEQVLSGSGIFALGYDAQSVTDTRSELGLRTDKSFALSDGVLTLRGRLGWAHDFNPDRAVAATFQALPGASFVVNGAAQASDSALTTAAVEMKWRSGWSASATFEGEFSNVTESYAGKGVVWYQW